jgi:hypothetical protein
LSGTERLAIQSSLQLKKLSKFSSQKAISVHREAMQVTTLDPDMEVKCLVYVESSDSLLSQGQALGTFCMLNREAFCIHTEACNNRSIGKLLASKAK